MKKIFSLVALVGMFALMSFTQSRKAETPIYVDCFSAADQAERICSCGRNDAVWYYVYNMCLMME